MSLVLRILSLLVCCIPFAGAAQGYQCVQEQAINYFTNKDHYLRAIRVDSVETVNGNTVLYPFKTARGDYFNKKLHKGGSWLGETITVLPDGTHWFQNYSGDTLVVRAQAPLNNNWILYDDTSTVWYEATVITVDTMTVIGALDSVKVLTITARDSSGIVSSDIYNGRTIVLSKDHGLVRCFDLYNFPSQFPHGFDYYNDKAGDPDFSLISFHNPTMLELHDYQPGDRFQRWDWIFQYAFRPSYTTLLVLDRVVIDPYKVEYKILKTIEKASIYPPYKKETLLSVYTLIADTGLSFDMERLPEEWGMGHFMKYNPSDTEFCYTGKSYSRWANHVYFFSDSADVNTFEPCGGPNYSYKLGSGEISWSDCVDPSGFNPSWMLKYVNKNNNPCGPYFTLAIDDVESERNEATIYPNPAQDYFYVETNAAPYKVLVTDITGRVVHSENIKAARHKIDTRHFPPGTYLLQLTDDKGNRMTQKIIVQH